MSPTPQFIQKKSLRVVRTMFNNAKSMVEVEQVKKICLLHGFKFDKLSMADHTFENAMQFNQIEDFLIKL